MGRYKVSIVVDLEGRLLGLSLLYSGPRIPQTRDPEVQSNNMAALVCPSPPPFYRIKRLLPAALSRKHSPADTLARNHHENS